MEFLADDDGEFYFLEMNTRLQVEHPVTELTTGLDLVELQLSVADGERLDTQPPVAHGHSIEARIYAEDPARSWQPQAGRIHRFEVPGTTTSFGPITGTGIRLDSGIVDSSTVSIHYDPMLAKVISYAPTRRRAAQVLADALARTRLHGVRTNRDLLVNVLRHQTFLDGDTDTAFFDTHGLTELARPLADDRTIRLAAVAAALADAAHNRAAATVMGDIPSGWRNVVSGNQHKTYLDARRARAPGRLSVHPRRRGAARRRWRDTGVGPPARGGAGRRRRRGHRVRGKPLRHRDFRRFAAGTGRL